MSDSNHINLLNPTDSFLKLHLKNRQMPLYRVNDVDDKKLLETCRDFESIFVNQMLKEMRKTIPKDGLIPQREEQEIYTSMFDEEVSKSISQQGRMGLAEMLYEQLRDKSKDKKSDEPGEKINGKQYLKFDRSH